MPDFKYISGTIINISNYWTEYYSDLGCNKVFTIIDAKGATINIIVTPNTYFLNHVTVSIGDPITAVYSGNSPISLVYPSTIRALIIYIRTIEENVKIDFFDNQLLSSDKSLKLNISDKTQILLINNQKFTDSLQNRNLIVIYKSVTESIPPETAPSQVIVLCLSQ